MRGVEVWQTVEQRIFTWTVIPNMICHVVHKMPTRHSFIYLFKNVCTRVRKKRIYVNQTFMYLFIQEFMHQEFCTQFMNTVYNVYLALYSRHSRSIYLFLKIFISMVPQTRWSLTVASSCEGNHIVYISAHSILLVIPLKICLSLPRTIHLYVCPWSNRL